MEHENPASYYDRTVSRRIRDLDEGNARVTRARDSIKRVASDPPATVLEVGCGVGATAALLADRWPLATVVACDLSAEAIEEGRRRFGRLRNLELHAGPLEELRSGIRAELVVMMDVYEHVEPGRREAFLHALAAHLADVAVVFLSVPTVRHQDHLRSSAPHDLQPVDEDITAADLVHVAHTLGGDLTYYEQIDVWHRRDYAHAVIRVGEEAFVEVRHRGRVRGLIERALERIAGRRPAG